MLFGSLGESVENRPFVDLYAGSGAMGIEALSRGASRCLFVERRAACVKVIQANLAKTGLGDQAQVWQSDVRRCVARVAAWLEGEAGAVFADPPYGEGTAGEVVVALLGTGLPGGTVVVLEHSCRDEYAGLPEPHWRRQVGEACLSRWEA